jgi:diphosphomevalonate decarboxylase
MTYSSTWRSPSNIALIKYWGKHGLQLPQNPSLSFTLSACHTQMTLRVTLEAASPGLEVLYDGKSRPSFEPKIKRFLNILHSTFPWLEKAFIHIDSFNTFPHSAGIASSASAMSAMALCLMDIHDQINNVPHHPNTEWLRRASEIARLGSGSASRSVFPQASIWGASAFAEGSSDLYAIPWQNHIAPFYKPYQDTILIVSTTEKSVSSTQGHELMESLPYAGTRYEEARRNMGSLIAYMKREEDVEQFIAIVESEALQLHALMMSGHTPFILMEPGTIALIKEIWRFRKETGLPVCFTLDAGPNVHLLYPEKHAAAVMDWIKATLAPFCADGQYIPDRVGAGPERLTAG